MKFSHSRVDSFISCPYKYKLSNIDKLVVYPNTDPTNALILGTALHTGIEKDIATAIEWYYNQFPIITDSHIEEAIKLESVIKKCRDILPEGGESELQITTDDFIGYIDYLVKVDEGVYDLYDFKYSNAVERYKESGQLHEYKYYFELTHEGQKIRDMYFLFAPKVSIRMKRKNKTNPRDERLEDFRLRLKKELEDKEAQLIRIDYNPKKVEEFHYNCEQLINAKEFPKNETRLCDWCDFKDFCQTGNDLDIDWCSTNFKNKKDYEEKTKDEFTK